MNHLPNFYKQPKIGKTLTKYMYVNFVFKYIFVENSKFLGSLFTELQYRNVRYLNNENLT